MNVRRLLFPAVALVAMLVTPSSSLAAPGNGATKVNQEYCTTNQFGTACFDLNYVVNTTETPSGNVSYVTNGHNTITNNPSFTPGCTFIGRSKFHDHYLLKDGVFHERGDHEESSLERNCGGVHEICTFTRRAHRVDGTYQYLIEDFRCTPL